MTYGLSLAQVFDSVQQNSQLVPAGSLKSGSGEFSIKTRLSRPPRLSPTSPSCQVSH